MEPIQRHLEELLPKTDFPYGELFDSARYSLGGKHLRPRAMLLTTEALGGDTDLALTPACALEMVHTYSLIHDDLPCLDNSDTRRGRPSLHKVVPESHALLTGDFLLTLAFETLADHPKLVRLLAQRCGGHGMIGGQLLELQHPTPDIHMLRIIHQKKTGALISAGLEMGGILADVDEATQKSLLRLGIHLGLAFQIRDDIEDGDGYVTLIGADSAQEALAHLRGEIDKELSNLPAGMNQVTTLFLP